MLETKFEKVLSAASVFASYLEYHNKNMTKTQYIMFRDLLDAVKEYYMEAQHDNESL